MQEQQTAAIAHTALRPVYLVARLWWAELAFLCAPLEIDPGPGAEDFFHRKYQSVNSGRIPTAATTTQWLQYFFAHSAQALVHSCIVVIECAQDITSVRRS
jgi:hypothetical protein